VSASNIYLGIKGHVVAVDNATGTELWRTKLGGNMNITNVALQGDMVVAFAGGKLFALDPATGTTRWQNSLKGLGWGPCILAPANPQSAVVVSAHKQQQDAAAAS